MIFMMAGTSPLSSLMLSVLRSPRCMHRLMAIWQKEHCQWPVRFIRLIRCVWGIYLQPTVRGDWHVWLELARLRKRTPAAARSNMNDTISLLNILSCFTIFELTLILLIPFYTGAIFMARRLQN